MSEKKAKDPGQVNIRMSPAVHAEIDAYLQTIGPAMRKAIESASVLTGGKAHGVLLHSFIAYAIRKALKSENPTVGKPFGSKIEKDVTEIMDRNVIAHENGEWWNVQVIGTGTLRDRNNNPTSVKRWITENADRLAAHYATVGIPENEVSDWNRKAGKYRMAMKNAEGR